ncbi:MAG: FAD-dependent thymidylate synthase, partial [Albidovulum sp.]
MTLTPEQQAEIAEARSEPRQTLRAVSEGMEAHLYTAHEVLDHGLVRVIDYMGDDAAITQAARVSYGRGTKAVQNDEGLIRYLMRHWHSTPFEMCEVKFHIKLPVFVARQWIRHRTANVNEYSARYSILDREFYIPAPEHL